MEQPKDRSMSMVHATAEQLQISNVEALRLLLTTTCTTSVFYKKAGERLPVKNVPGRIIDAKGESIGPKKTKVMVLVSHPSEDESKAGLYFSGFTGSEFFQACKKVGLNPTGWYVTALCKYRYPQNRKKPLKDWVKDSNYILDKEINLVKPDYILCMGGDPFNYFFPDLKITDRKDTVLTWKNSKLFPMISISNLVAQPETKTEFENSLKLFKDVLEGNTKEAEQDLSITVIEDMESLKSWIDSNLKKKYWAIDAEWGYYGLRTIQFCAEEGKATVIVLRKEGMGDNILDPVEVGTELKRLLERDGVVVFGHNFRSDLHFLKDMGLEIMPQVLKGADTILLHHALYPMEDQKLEAVANRLLRCGRYDTEMSYYRSKNKKLVELFGFSYAPEATLIPYGAHDAEKTFKLFKYLLKEISKPENEGPKNLVFQTTMPATEGIFEMEHSGLFVDMERAEMFEVAFRQKREELLQQVRDQFEWPEFNPNSGPQLIELLFGEKYNRKRKLDGEGWERIRPENAPCLNLNPVKTTDKRLWEEIIGTRDEDICTPATDDETLGILSEQEPQLSLLRDYAYISKICSNYFPEAEKYKGQFYQFKGLKSWRGKDGAIHSSFAQLAETGRWKSYRPNVQNWPTQREPDFKRIFDNPQWPKLKSMIIPEPDMDVFVESDLKTAEVVALAHLSGDKNMLEVIMDPARDIHSEQAIKYFNLGYKPSCGVGTKKWINGQYSPVTGKVQKIIDNKVYISDKVVEIWPGHDIKVKEGQVVQEGQLITTEFSATRIAAKTVVFG